MLEWGNGNETLHIVTVFAHSTFTKISTRHIIKGVRALIGANVKNCISGVVPSEWREVER